jgi:hypothetical protein
VASDVRQNFTATHLRAALNDDVVRFFQATKGNDTFRTPLGTRVRAPGFDFKSSEKLFKALSGQTENLIKLDLEIARRNIQIRAIEERQRAYFSRGAIRDRGAGEDKAPNFRQRARDIINNLPHNQAALSKTDRTPLASAYKRPTVKQSFGDVIDNAQPRNTSLTLDLQSTVSVIANTSVAIAPLEDTPAPTPATNYLVRLSSRVDLDNNRSELASSAGSLQIRDAAGNVVRTLDNNTPTVITAAEFANLHYQATDNEALFDELDYISIVPINETGTAGFDAADEVGGLATITLGVKETVNLVAQGQERVYQSAAFVEAGARFKRVQVEFDGSVAAGDVSAALAAGDARLTVSEYGRPETGEKANQGTLNLAESSGNRLVFDFNGITPRDGALVQLRFLAPTNTDTINKINVSFS